MDDNEMIAELRRRAESKAMSKVLLAEMGISLELPSIITNAYPDMEQEMRKKEDLEIGSLALSADLIEGTYTGDPLDPAKIAATLRKFADEEENFAWRQDSEAEDKEFDAEYGGDNEDEDAESEEELRESAEELREYAESARETAKFYREAADRVERNFNGSPTV